MIYHHDIIFAHEEALSPTNRYWSDMQTLYFPSFHFISLSRVFINIFESFSKLYHFIKKKKKKSKVKNFIFKIKINFTKQFLSFSNKIQHYNIETFMMLRSSSIVRFPIRKWAYSTSSPLR